jgi:hypothetical protein
MRRIGLHALAALLMVWTSLACSPSAGAERVEVLASEPVAAAPSNEVALGYGRVVDPQGRPVSNATVELGYDGRVLGRAVSREFGEFELRGTLVRTETLVPFLLTARASDDELARQLARLPHTFRIGVGPHDHDPRGLDLGEIVLEPTHTLEVRLAGAQGPIEVEAHAYDSTQRPFEFIGWAPVARARANADGTLQVRGLPAGWIQVTASDGAKGACECVQVPLTTTVELNLEPLRTCDINVRDAETRAPIADAEVTLRLMASEPCGSASHYPILPEGRLGYSSLVRPQLRHWATQPTVRTNGFGFVRVTGLPPGKHYECRVSASRSRQGSPGYAARQVTLRPPDGVHEILLQPQRLKTLRWDIVDAYEKRPADGTVIRLLRCTSEGELLPVPDLEGRMENGDLVVCDVPDEDVLDFLAVAPNGARAWVSYSARRNPFVYAFLAPRTVRVTLRDAQGRPATGVGVVAEYKSAPALETLLLLPRRKRTDEFGMALLEDLFPEPVQVFAEHRANGTDKGPWPHKQLLGEFDLSSCTAIALEATLRPPSRGIATVRIDGRPALPNDFTCTPKPTWPWPEDGRLNFVFGWPESGAPVTINLSAPGLIPATATVTPSPDSSPVHFNLDLFTECALRVRVPRLATIELTAERFETASGAWEEASHSHGSPVAITDEWLERRVGQLRPGRWRMRDKLSGAVSTEVELGPDQRAGVVTLLGQ